MKNIVNKIKQKKQVLRDARTVLKNEFFGMNDIIDNVIDSISAWYICPEFITRPVIINLWGMTGVGKTKLVRRITELLGYSEKFIEIQMDAPTTNVYSSNLSKLSNILLDSKIKENEPGIMLLDEFQKFRTIDIYGRDIERNLYTDIWILLSDGIFSASTTLLNYIDQMLLEKENEYLSGIKIKNSYYESKMLQKFLNYSASIKEITNWDYETLISNINETPPDKNLQFNYSKLLIFISGNIDEAYSMAQKSDDCDTDADFYHELTKKISISDIKSSLHTKFRPEQIARLGNVHIIYPSLNKNTYIELINHTCNQYINNIKSLSNVSFLLTNFFKSQIYDNSVYPTQGTRPVFSSIHNILGNTLIDITIWCLENNISEATIDMNPSASEIVVISEALIKTFKITLEINNKKNKMTKDFKTYIAVHETGHALVYALLIKSPPYELKINTASYNGGYILTNFSNIINTAAFLRNNICISLAGAAAEEIIFSKDKKSSGSLSDIVSATKIASNYTRKYGMGNEIKKTEAQAEKTEWCIDLNETDKHISKLLETEYNRAKKLIIDNIEIFKKITNKVLEENTLSKLELFELLRNDIELTLDNSDENYYDLWITYQNNTNNNYQMID